jgi:hypothetical protein
MSKISTDSQVFDADSTADEIVASAVISREEHRKYLLMRTDAFEWNPDDQRQIWIPDWAASLIILYQRLNEHESPKLAGYPYEGLTDKLFEMLLEGGFRHWTTDTHWFIKGGPKTRKEIEEWFDDDSQYEEGTQACLCLPIEGGTPHNVSALCPNGLGHQQKEGKMSNELLMNIVAVDGPDGPRVDREDDKGNTLTVSLRDWQTIAMFQSASLLLSCLEAKNRLCEELADIKQSCVQKLEQRAMGSNCLESTWIPQSYVIRTAKTLGLEKMGHSLSHPGLRFRAGPGITILAVEGDYGPNGNDCVAAQFRVSEQDWRDIELSQSVERVLEHLKSTSTSADPQGLVNTDDVTAVLQQIRREATKVFPTKYAARSEWVNQDIVERALKTLEPGHAERMWEEKVDGWQDGDDEMARQVYEGETGGCAKQ